MNEHPPTVSASISSGPLASRCWGLILAGGLGARLGGDRPKAFVPLAGRPLLRWSLAAFAGHPEVTDILVAVPRGWERSFREDVLSPFQEEAPEQAAKIRGVVPGGERRQDSARLALKNARDGWRRELEAQERRVRL